ncbi:MAG: DUF1365 domain-containing protein [Pseudomonadales bacterium]|nr:DUF1365 domain-containing protein [Pseudomonadales bacterium]
MKSGIYTGTIQHRRFGPQGNAFRYRIFMSYLDLDELPGLFDRFWLWSARRPAPAWFRRRDYHGDPQRSLAVAVRDLVERESGERPVGPIRLLTHLRFLGVCFNPVSFYYVFDAAGETLETIIAEITNTPWKERHAYVLPLTTGTRVGAKGWRFVFDKRFHVSPFLPMDMHYDWRFTVPANGLDIHMENWREGRSQFDATLHLRREEIASGSLARALLSVPWVTVKVTALIYWQAFKLLVKRAPFHAHPSKLPAARREQLNDERYDHR